MSFAGEIQKKQASIEELITKRIATLEADLAAAKASQSSPQLDRVDKNIADLKDFVLELWTHLRREISELQYAADKLDMRSRTNCLLFRGYSEAPDVTPLQLVQDTLKQRFGIADVSGVDYCHRLGVRTEGTDRAVMVHFSSYSLRNQIWQQKSKLKGSNISVCESLTKLRQEAFSAARKHFGVRNCWTQDGNVFIKAADGTKHKVVTLKELQNLLEKYPSPSAGNIQPSHHLKNDEIKSRPKRTPKNK